MLIIKKAINKSRNMKSTSFMIDGVGILELWVSKQSRNKLKVVSSWLALNLSDFKLLKTWCCQA